MAGTEQGSAALDLAAAQQGLDAQPFSRLVQARSGVCAVAQGPVLPRNGAPDGGGAGQDLSG
ncbi:hypothetical protein ACH4TE_02650 [Streptomyces sioyaensis]|uniref:hypothetical protein n=1 Tax=Streptomyces sioyaensis TaxID=67364 RepID=UPI0037880DE0